MGMDVYHESGIILDIGDMLGLITDDNLKQTIEEIMKITEEHKQVYEKEIADYAEQEKNKDNPEKKLQHEKKLQQYNKDKAEWDKKQVIYLETYDKLVEDGTCTQENVDKIWPGNQPEKPVLVHYSINQWKKEARDHYQKLFGSITKNSDINEVCDALSNLVNIDDDDGYDSGIMMGDSACELWQRILKSYDQLPDLCDIRVFNSNRLSGYDVPTEEPCFVFDDSECFKTTKTKKGEALDELVGYELESKEWTIMSV
tara:strand:- start:905 stop:1675 length:771 start_codon:yes stop_codon:yes gene_type:complete